MINTITRNLRNLHNDVLETSWLKSLLDDVPKRKHTLVFLTFYQIIHKCLIGQQTNVDPQEAMKKLSRRIIHPQKPITALKIYFIIHQLRKEMFTLLSEQTLEKDNGKDAADALLFVIAQNYLNYLKNESKNPMDLINDIYKMLRPLEAILIKCNIPIVIQIAIKLLMDMVHHYKQFQNNGILEFNGRIIDQTCIDSIRLVRSSKQLQRFVQLKQLLPLSVEQIESINNVQNIIQNNITSTPTKNRSINVNNNTKCNDFTIKIKKEIPHTQQGTLMIQPKIQNLFMPTEIINGDRRLSVQPASTRRSRMVGPSTIRASSIMNSFFDTRQSPLSFIIHK